MQKYISFAHCSRHRLVREIDQFNYSDSSLLRMESSDGMIFIRPNSSSRSFLPIYHSTVSENVEMYMKFKQMAQASQAFNNVGGGIVLCSDNVLSGSFNSIEACFGLVAATGTNYTSSVRFGSNTGGTLTGVLDLSIATKTLSEQVQAWKHLKVKKVGTNYYVKAWWDGDVEPAYSAAQNISLYMSGYYGINLSSRASVMMIQCVSIGVGEDAPMAPPANRTVSGVIYKPDNTIAAGATVRLYHAYTGVLLGRVLANENGEYSFSLPILETELVHIVGVDVNGTEWKPPIHEIYPVL